MPRNRCRRGVRWPVNLCRGACFVELLNVGEMSGLVLNVLCSRVPFGLNGCSFFRGSRALWILSENNRRTVPKMTRENRLSVLRWPLFRRAVDTIMHFHCFRFLLLLFLLLLIRIAVLCGAQIFFFFFAAICEGTLSRMCMHVWFDVGSFFFSLLFFFQAQTFRS